MDIFETLRRVLGCMYISDLKFSPFREKALKLLSVMNIDGEQKESVCKYLRA